VYNNSKLQVGAYSRLGAGLTIMNSNFHYIIDTTTGKVNDHKSDIIIGDNCWVGMDTFIGKGAILPNRTIVSAHSVVNRDYSDLPDFSVISGNPAKLVAQNKARIFNYVEEEKIKKIMMQNGEKNVLIDLSENDIEDIISFKLTQYLSDTKSF